MIEQGSGVILHLNSASGAGAMPATEAFMRYLAAGAPSYLTKKTGDGL